ncbi:MULTISPECIES: phosphatase PAP2 family protein [unclassified Shewanella]|uniref:phosphatase PAP2 family protein n=1 Tax=unclassified Shewanella TaxID=196818 RepID=UPI000C832B8D|nr:MULTISPECIES: phosphatase PAP2 family protein [unclassified Shewanella]MDO6620866.1 phosphatase PAP2 family protein [Shewanella sp. 6_MG-2023]MDO6641268.1 phosphatase PAP2 family protein [Shewanella sp. 5_MG-2023]MDO6679418.1 phosphatase PAP2 family protein [Shewanella sp. 4_MG-2023]MDO6775366.1 phosphatase PAP2 family protein [Shewanella sp. 3_MG-2023]PMG51463.1 phosphoesterase [Shewanella sp. 10N.286.52.B9]
MAMTISALDKFVFCHIITFCRTHELTPLAKRISASGDGHYYVYMAVGLLFLHPQGSQFFNLMLVSFIIELPLYFVFKNAIRRTRPCAAFAGFDSSFQASDKFSLPSGHTAAAFIMAMAITSTFPALWPIAMTWAVAIGLSRIALGVHYPLDIVAGIGLGVGVVILAEPLI